MIVPYRKLLKKMDLFLEKTARKTTDSPVFLKVGNFRDKTEVARLVKYEPTAHGKSKGLPTEYEVVFSKREINECRAKNPHCERDMKQIIAHELAHIKYPAPRTPTGRYIHTASFRKECHRLGGGERCVARGVERRRR